MSTRPCCYIDPATGARCEAAAEWQVWDGPTPDDYTEACTVHVGALLTDAPEHRVYPITEAAGDHAH